MGANRREVLGHIDCPVCGLDMQIKLDKNDQASGYCADCSQQLFTRTDHKSGLLLKRMRPIQPGQAAPVDKTAPVEIPVFVPPAAPAPAAKAAPARQAGAQDENKGQDEANPVQAKKNAPEAANPVALGGAKPSAWLTPLLGASARKGKHAS